MLSLSIRHRGNVGYRKTTKEIERLREKLSERNCGSEKNRHAKNGGAGGGGWCERESHEDAGENPAKVGWTRGKNGRGPVDEESGCD